MSDSCQSALCKRASSDATPLFSEWRLEDSRKCAVWAIFDRGENRLPGSQVNCRQGDSDQIGERYKEGGEGGGLANMKTAKGRKGMMVWVHATQHCGSSFRRRLFNLGLNNGGL